MALKRTGTLTLRITGISMVPLLRPGDRVVVETCSRKDLVPGDLLLLEDTTPVVHRFLFREPGGLIVTRGDGCSADDHPCSTDRILGRARRRIRDQRALDLDRGWQRFKGRLTALRHSLRHLAGRWRASFR